MEQNLPRLLDSLQFNPQILHPFLVHFSPPAAPGDALVPCGLISLSMRGSSATDWRDCSDRMDHGSMEVLEVCFGIFVCVCVF